MAGLRTSSPHPPKGHQPLPSHDMTRFYALIPALAVLAFLMPTVFAAVTTAIGAAEAISRLTGGR